MSSAKADHEPETPLDAAGYPAPPPLDSLPAVPAGFPQPKLSSFRGWYPSDTEQRAIEGALTDLASFGDYMTVLGSTAPPLARVTDGLADAQTWREIRRRTEAWDAYVRARDAMAWRHAFTVLDDLKPLFTIAASRSPELVAKYPSLAALFAASTARAARSVETRRKNAKDAAERAKADADAPADAEALRALLRPAAPAPAAGNTVNVTLK